MSIFGKEKAISDKYYLQSFVMGGNDILSMKKLTIIDGFTYKHYGLERGCLSKNEEGGGISCRGWIEIWKWRWWMKFFHIHCARSGNRRVLGKDSWNERYLGFDCETAWVANSCMFLLFPITAKSRP